MTLQWRQMTDGGVPENAFIAGVEEKKKRVFVARAKHNNAFQPCQLFEGDSGARMPYGGKKCIMPKYEVLADNDALCWKSLQVADFTFLYLFVSTCTYL